MIFRAQPIQLAATSINGDLVPLMVCYSLREESVLMRTYPRIKISEAMLIEARQLEDSVRVHRTRASEVDSLAGILGEFAFAEFLDGD